MQNMRHKSHNNGANLFHLFLLIFIISNLLIPLSTADDINYYYYIDAISELHTLNHETNITSYDNDQPMQQHAQIDFSNYPIGTNLTTIGGSSFGNSSVEQYNIDDKYYVNTATSGNEIYGNQLDHNFDEITAENHTDYNIGKNNLLIYSDFTDSSGTNCYSELYDSVISNHNNSIHLSDSSYTTSALISYSFSSVSSDTNIEFWVYNSDVTDRSNIRLLSGSNTVLLLYNDADSLYYYTTYANYIDNIIDTTWYHIRIELDLTADTFDLYLDTVNVVSNGLLYNNGNYNNIDELTIATTNSPTGYDVYFDAIGCEWNDYTQNTNHYLSMTDKYFETSFYLTEYSADTGLNHKYFTFDNIDSNGFSIRFSRQTVYTGYVYTQIYISGWSITSSDFSYVNLYDYSLYFLEIGIVSSQIYYKLYNQSLNVIQTSYASIKSNLPLSNMSTEIWFAGNSSAYHFNSFDANYELNNSLCNSFYPYSNYTLNRCHIQYFYSENYQLEHINIHIPAAITGYYQYYLRVDEISVILINTSDYQFTSKYTTVNVSAILSIGVSNITIPQLNYNLSEDEIQDTGFNYYNQSYTPITYQMEKFDTFNSTFIVNCSLQVIWLFNEIIEDSPLLDLIVNSIAPILMLAIFIFAGYQIKGSKGALIGIIIGLICFISTDMIIWYNGIILIGIDIFILIIISKKNEGVEF